MCRVCLWTAVFSLLALPSAAQVPESGTYRMDRITVAAGARVIASANWENSVVIAQEGPAGVTSVCEQGAIASLGFWSVLGDLPMLVRLDVRRGASNPDDVDLRWTGNANGFQVYRAFSPEDVLNPLYLYGETPGCALTDVNAFESDIIFYQVVAGP